MSDLTDDSIDASGLNPAERRILQDKANASDQLAAELAAARQQLAVSQSGAQLSEAQMKALGAVHEGEWSAEAVSKTIADLGWNQAPQQGGVPQADVQAMQRIDQASAGEPTGPPPGAGQKLEEILRQVKTLGNQQLQQAMPAAMEAIREAGLNFGSLQFGSAERIPDWGATK